MLDWLIGWVWALGWRAAITTACIMTLQHILAQAGYHIDNWSMWVASILVILANRVWAGLGR